MQQYNISKSDPPIVVEGEDPLTEVARKLVQERKGKTGTTLKAVIIE